MSIFSTCTPKPNIIRIADWMARMGEYKARMACIEAAKEQAEEQAYLESREYALGETGFSDSEMSEAFSLKY